MRGLLAPLIKLIAFLVVTSFATYVLAATIANTSYGDTTTYRADFTDASGLNIGDDVRVAGVRVGTVSGISIVRHNTAEVTFSVEKARPLPASVQVTLRYRNLVGQRYIDVEQGNPGDSTKMQDPNKAIPLSRTHPAVDLTVLFAGFKPLFEGLDADQINKLSGEIIQTLQGEGGSLELLFTTRRRPDELPRRQGQGDRRRHQQPEFGAEHDRPARHRAVEPHRPVAGLHLRRSPNDRQTIGNAITGINNLSTHTANLLTQVREAAGQGHHRHHRPRRRAQRQQRNDQVRPAQPARRPSAR